MSGSKLTYIDDSLLREQIEGRFSEIRTECIRQSRFFKRRIATCKKKILQIEKDGKKQKVTYTEEEFILEQLEGEVYNLIDSSLLELKNKFSNGEIDVKKYLYEYKKKTEGKYWPSIIVEAQLGLDVNELAEQLTSNGYEIADNDYDISEDSALKLKLFRLLHVKIPPESMIIEKTAAIDGVIALYDPDKSVNIPKPITEPSGYGIKLAESIPMIWPQSEPVPPDMPSPGSNSKICIVDTGINASHPDFKNRIVAWRDFTAEEDGNDYCGHGTHCAGIAAGDGAASNGEYCGVAPYSLLLSAKVLNKNGSGRVSDILLGLRWAHDQGVDVVSLSLGGDGIIDGRSILSRACSALVENGIAVCVSAGNSGPSKGTITIPGDSPEVITVGAIDKSSKMAEFSSRGPTENPEYTGNKPNVVAPGVNIVSCCSTNAEKGPNNSGNPYYISYSGTSMACPHVAGAMAVIISYTKHIGLNITIKELIQIIQEAALPLSGEHEHSQGKGLIQIHASLMRLYQRISPTSKTIDHLSTISHTSQCTTNLDFSISQSQEMESILRKKSAKSTIPNQIYCSSCGEKILTKLDIAGHCMDNGCDEPICTNCWSIKLRRKCRIHAKHENIYRTKGDSPPSINSSFTKDIAALYSHALEDNLAIPIDVPEEIIKVGLLVSQSEEEGHHLSMGGMIGSVEQISKALNIIEPYDIGEDVYCNIACWENLRNSVVPYADGDLNSSIAIIEPSSMKVLELRRLTNGRTTHECYLNITKQTSSTAFYAIGGIGLRIYQNGDWIAQIIKERKLGRLVYRNIPLWINKFVDLIHAMQIKPAFIKDLLHYCLLISERRYGAGIFLTDPSQLNGFISKASSPRKRYSLNDMTEEIFQKITTKDGATVIDRDGNICLYGVKFMAAGGRLDSAVDVSSKVADLVGIIVSEDGICSIVHKGKDFAIRHD